LSKEIKARFVVEDYSQGSLLKVCPPVVAANNSLAPQPGYQTDQLTPEAAELIYSETKQMIEELMESAQQQSEQLLLQAKAQAQDILEKSQAEVEILKEQAYKTGFEQGYQDGYSRADEEVHKLQDQTKTLLETLLKDREEAFQRYEKEIVDLVILLTEKILGTAAETKPEIINHLVKKVLAEAGEAEKMTIKVNPIHVPYLGSFEKIQIVEDSSLLPGECVVVSENGFIESRISEQLAILKQTMLDVTGHA